MADLRAELLAAVEQNIALAWDCPNVLRRLYGVRAVVEYLSLHTETVCTDLRGACSMRLADVLAELAPVVGFTSLIAAPSSVGTAQETTLDLATAETRLADVVSLQAAAQSDAAWWGYEGQRAYWSCLVDLARAAELVGPNSLPDVPLPDRGGVVMDVASDMEKFGVRVLTEAQASHE